MDVEVYWNGRRVGLLRNVELDQPWYLGEWVADDRPKFAAELAAQGCLPVMLRTPDGASNAPALATVGLIPGEAVAFRFSHGSRAEPGAAADGGGR